MENVLELCYIQEAILQFKFSAVHVISLINFNFILPKVNIDCIRQESGVNKNTSKRDIYSHLCVDKNNE